MLKMKFYVWMKYVQCEHEFCRSCAHFLESNAHTTPISTNIKLQNISIEVLVTKISSNNVKNWDVRLCCVEQMSEIAQTWKGAHPCVVFLSPYISSALLSLLFDCPSSSY